MKRRVLHGVFLGLALSASLVTAPHAFTLGDLRGSVIIGRGLDLSVLVQAAPNEEISASCFTADVFHADTPQAPATVMVTPLPDAPNPSYKVRIQSRALVDEPVVTVQLRSTCATPYTRRYVLLADFPVVVMPLPDQVPAPALTPPEVVKAPAPAALATPPAAIPQGDAVAAAAAASATTPKASVAKQIKRKKSRSARKKTSTGVQRGPERATATTTPIQTAQAEPAKSTLKLETLNLPSGQPDGLAATPLALPSQESLLQAKQIETLQSELKALKELTAQNNTALAQMQVQLQKAQTERVSLQLFYVVLALLFLCIAVLVWLLWQRYRDQPEREAGVSILSEMAGSASDFTNSSVATDAAKIWPATQKPARSWSQAESGTATPDKPVSNAPVRATAPVEPLDKSAIPATLQDLNHAFTNTRLQEAGNSNFGVISHEEVDLDIDMSSWAGLAGSDQPDNPTTESILDIRQQAEFFVSLGQTERAIVVLKKQIAQAKQPNPFIYLDLLSLFHSLGYKTDFREYRTAFNRHFNCVLPDFPAYHLEGLDLMAYSDELARLTQVWNRKEVLAYLDACIYRSEQASAQPSFELAAFRDLLLLLAIAEQVQAQA